MEWYLPLIWAGIIGTAVAMYVILDGFDLGIGMLFPFAKDDDERDQMMASIAPFWDGNETWLVLGGVGLLVAFPLAYAVIMPALYLPVIVMLLALVFRGVAFEFREMAHSKALWNVAFAGGSTLAGFCQGVILGGLIQGIRVENGAFAGGAVRLGDAVCAAVRARRRRRLCAARRDLAGDEDRRAGRRPRPRAGQDAAARGAGLHGGGQPVDAACNSRASRSAGSRCRISLSLAGAARHRADRVRRLALRSARSTRPRRSSRRSGCSCSAISAW